MEEQIKKTAARVRTTFAYFWMLPILLVLLGETGGGWVGMYAGYVCERGGSIYYSMGLHLLFNLWGTLSGFFPDPGNSVVVFAVVIVVTIVSLAAGFVLFNKGRRKLPINSTGI